MKLPSIILDIIGPYFSEITFIEESMWCAQECSPLWRKIDMSGSVWNSLRADSMKKVQNLGGALTRYDCGEDRYVEGILSSEYYIFYPAIPNKMRRLIEKSSFGRDDFRSCIDGKHPEPEPNTPERVSARRDEGLRIFDDMVVEAPLILNSVSSRIINLNFTNVPNLERANYWANRVWQFYRNHYAREDPTKVHDTSAYHKNECFRLARKFGSFQIGLLGDS